MATTSELMILMPPSPIAPMPSSGWTGTPSLRTRITSRGAPSARATSAATGTPPRGSPSTTTSAPRRCSIRSASRLPASDLSRNDMAIASVRFQSAPSDWIGREAMVPIVPARGDGRSGQQRPEQGPRADAVLAAPVLARHEVGDASVAERTNLGADAVLITDNRDVGRPAGAFAVEHGPVGRQFPVDRED